MNWLRPSLILAQLDIFREYWNSHRISSQAKKALPLGTSPCQVFLVPESAHPGAKDFSIRVNPKTVQRMREGLGGEDARCKVYEFVDAEFRATADDAYVELGAPEISLAAAWGVFSLVVDWIRSNDSSTAY